MKKIFFMAIVFIVSTVAVFAQKTLKTYSGEMTKPTDILGKLIKYGDKTGSGTYVYYELPDGQRVKHGKFEFNYSYNDYYTVSGTYIDGKKEGVWTFIERGSSTKKIIDNASITYKDDKPNGSFTCNVYGFLDAINCTGTMKNGHYKGQITIKTPHSEGTIKGNFNDDGWAHGEWIIERKKGVPIRQKIEYFEGLLLKVINFDLSNGDMTVLYELPQAEIEEIKNTFNPTDSTFKIAGEQYKRIQVNSGEDDIDTKLFPNTWGGKTLVSMFNGNEPSIDSFIPLVNGFATKEIDNNWRIAKHREELQKKEEEEYQRRLKLEEDNRKIEERRQADLQEHQERIQRLEDLHKIVLSNDESITSLYSRENSPARLLLGDFVNKIKKYDIFNAYKIVYENVDDNDEANLKEMLEIQEIVMQLADKKTKEVEKALAGIANEMEPIHPYRKNRDTKEFVRFFKEEALDLCK